MTSNGNTISRFNSSSIVPFWLNGQEVIGSSTFEVTSPLDNQPIYRASAASEEDVKKAVASAEEAFKTWSSTKPSVRRDVFLKAAEEFRKRRDELRQYSYKETGQAPAFFGFEYSAAIDICVSIAGLIQIASESTAPVVNEGSALLLKEPWGVVLAIAPWNAPHVLGVRAILTPLAM
jgi:acyl-CoA reductase-like NAD-dependent aldehyde dehydrogenase